MLWLGEKRGYLADWITQRWVQISGRKIELSRYPWLDGPAGSTRRIGKEYFANLAAESGYVIDASSVPCGLMENFDELVTDRSQILRIDSRVIDFYENTSEYDLDAWSEWRGAFRSFGKLLALIFSRRLQQLNVPLSALDTSKGITSEVFRIIDPESNETVYTAWVREIAGSKNTLYVGSYSLCKVPGYGNPCVKVVFPLPNGNAIVIMKPVVHDDGTLSVVSSGRTFGDPGFYFVLHTRSGKCWARYVRTLKESIHVYSDRDSVVRADHELQIWGVKFLRLHYRLVRRKRDLS